MCSYKSLVILFTDNMDIKTKTDITDKCILFKKTISTAAPANKNYTAPVSNAHDQNRWYRSYLPSDHTAH